MLTGRHYQTGQPIYVHWSGLEVKIEPLMESLSGPFLYPALTDLQINGFAGVDLNAETLSNEEFGRMAVTLARQGVSRFLATIVTNDYAFIKERLRRLTALKQHHPFGSLLMGVHLEGPFLSPEDGPRGAHPKDFIQPPRLDWVEDWQEAAQGNLCMLTMSPHWENSTQFIQSVTKMGIAVAIGHTHASPQQISEAVAAGARLVTHFGNGVHPFLPRHPNYLWQQLAEDELWLSVIGDGYHLPQSVLKTCLAVKGRKLFLVSDTVGLAGLPPGEYTTLIGGRVELTASGRLQMVDHPELLAGSVKPLGDAVEQVYRWGLINYAEAWHMASVRPLEFLLAVSGSQEDANHMAWSDVVVKDAPGPQGRLMALYKQGELIRFPEENT